MRILISVCWQPDGQHLNGCRNTVMNNPNVEIRTGLGVTGVKKSEAAIPKVTGLYYDGGLDEDFDCIIAANGRRSNAPEWLRDVGIEVPDEVVEDTGIIYYSRFTVYLMVSSSPLGIV
ncbi:MAG: hypothetical protein CM15mP49_36230 [Actinomycetota bacterium]|nr:MAG: hypothetical protein CM15mP49_36230 [Actinomycetota bacterium]